MKGYWAMMNYTNCEDQWKLGKSAGHQEVGMIQCVFRMMR